jgi:hypothetical protein
MIQNFVGVSSQAVRLCSVQVNVTKSFLTSTSNVITIPAPTGLTITNLISCAAAIFPGTIQVVDVAGTLEVQFNASIFFTVQLHNNNVILLSDTITVQGVLGPTSEVKVTSGGCTVPTLSCINSSIGPGGASISGQIQVGPFTCETCQLKSVKVVLDPDVPDPVGPPIDP